MKKFLASVLLLFSLHAGAFAQGTGQLPAYTMWGNPTASKAPATVATITQILDGALSCSAQGSVLYRGASSWSCLAPGTSGRPLVTNGAAANPSYSALALGGLATGSVDTAIGYWGSTTASALAVNNCANALTYSTGTHTFGCNATAGTGNVVGSGSPTVGDLASMSNTSATAIVGTGYNATQIPGLIPTTATVTISNASPGVITWTAHGLTANTPVYFCTTGALPTGLTACVPAVGAVSANTYVSNPTLYYVVGSSITANTFQVATSVANAKAGTAVNTSSAGSGTHTAFANVMACAGCVGEEVWNTAPITSPNVSSGADTIFNSISLTPGIWRISGQVGIFGTSGSTVFTTVHGNYGIGISSISTTPYNGVSAAHVTSNQSNGWVLTMNPSSVPVFSNSTINAVCEPVFSGGTATCYGDLRAIRIH